MNQVSLAEPSVDSPALPLRSRNFHVVGERGHVLFADGRREADAWGSCSTEDMRRAYEDGYRIDTHVVESEEGSLALDINSSTLVAVYEPAAEVLRGFSALPEKRPPLSRMSQPQVDNILEELGELQRYGVFRWHHGDAVPVRVPAASVDMIPVSTFIVSVTRSCNLACTYCYDIHRHAVGVNMRDQTADDTVEFILKAAARASHISVDFTGGEPFLAFPVIRRIADRVDAAAALQGKAVAFSSTTNGTSLTKSVLDFMRERKFTLALSIDGPKEIHDAGRRTTTGKPTYDAVVRAIPKLREALGDRLTARATVLPEHLGEVDRIVAHLRGLGFERVSVSPARESVRPEKPSEDELARLRDLLVRSFVAGDVPFRYMETFSVLFGVQRLLRDGGKKCFGCPTGAGLKMLAIDTNGDVYPCFREFGREDIRMGNVSRNVDTAVMRTRMVNNHVYARPCASCWARHLCGGGCPMDSIKYENSLDVPVEEICDLLRTGVEAHMLAFARRECERVGVPFAADPA